MLLQVFLTGVGLSMDAFAVSVCKGLKMRRVDYKYMMLIALFFGGFQGLMPVIGCFLGRGFEQYITSVDHWIAFVLLSLIGGQMIVECIKNEEDDSEISYDIKELFVLAIATSIDALVVGITFAFLDVDIWIAAIVIACTTFVFSSVGVIVGNRFGVRYKSKAELAGGIILIGIGIKVLLEGLGIIG